MSQQSTRKATPKGKYPIGSLHGGALCTVVIGVLLIAVLAVYLATDNGSSKPDSSTSPSAVTAQLDEMSIKLDHKTVHAGNVRVTVHNTGTVMHELVILQTDTKAADLPTDAGGRASEKASIGELADVAAGASATKTFSLKAGHYAVICNLPGHYAAGMITDLTVR